MDHEDGVVTLTGALPPFSSAADDADPKELVDPSELGGNVKKSVSSPATPTANPSTLMVAFATRASARVLLFTDASTRRRESPPISVLGRSSRPALSIAVSDRDTEPPPSSHQATARTLPLCTSIASMLYRVAPPFKLEKRSMTISPVSSYQTQPMGIVSFAVMLGDTLRTFALFLARTSTLSNATSFSSVDVTKCQSAPFDDIALQFDAESWVR
mmetsp:Transcript_7956/g.25434  ORF Transcript_7956/g.25434 Transcript_7956/m.25434 type:complete len:215 (+) Transcript_7956:255-899(+)